MITGQEVEVPTRTRTTTVTVRALRAIHRRMPYLDLSTTAHETLAAGLDAGRAALDHALTSGASPQVKGWKLTLHAFDYNLDFFEVGALDDDRFKIADPELRIVERAGNPPRHRLTQTTPSCLDGVPPRASVSDSNRTPLRAASCRTRVVRSSSQRASPLRTTPRQPRERRSPPRSSVGFCRRVRHVSVGLTGFEPATP
ncbi:MAG: hypothetical protein DI639_16415 [Leifsonia xyli]|nr:MAG: hypothetical protein DI639_16415 [Leifsonia xyli]